MSRKWDVTKSLPRLCGTWPARPSGTSHTRQPGSTPEDTRDRRGDAILKQNTVALGLVGKSKHSIGKQAEVLSSHSELCPGSASAPERLQGKMSSGINLLMGERNVSVTLAWPLGCSPSLRS